MRALGFLVVFLVTACGGDAVPSCQEAVTAYYGAGCTFINLANNTPYTLNESIQSCKDINAAVPDQCRQDFDDYVTCLDGVSSSAHCTDCTREQDKLQACH